MSEYYTIENYETIEYMDDEHTEYHTLLLYQFLV